MRQVEPYKLEITSDKKSTSPVLVLIATESEFETFITPLVKHCAIMMGAFKKSEYIQFFSD